MKDAKQIIIVRRDLGMSRGKMAAQVAHASLGCILAITNKGHEFNEHYFSINFLDNSPLDSWLNGKFTKIVLAVDSEEELVDIYNKAQEEELVSVLITDAGLTEFNNVPTKTCVGIGPYFPEDIDKVTGHLQIFR